MNEAFRRLADMEFTEVVLWVLETDDRARSFYEKGRLTAGGSVKVDEVNGPRVSEIRYVRPL